MIVPGVVARRYALQRDYVIEVSGRVKDIISRYAEDQRFPFVGRIKGIESLTEKLECGRYGRWREIDDLYACVVVMPTLHPEPDILGFLQERFEPVLIRRRGSTLKDPSVFRFDATRFVGRLRTDERLPEDSPLRSIRFEVQLRSAFEHAWSAATHHLAYKADQIDWRRLRLAAQLKASVEQLDQVLVGFDEAADRVAEHRWPEIDAKKLIEGFFRSRFADHQLPEDLAPESWSRFCDNLYSLIISTSTTPVRDKEAFVRAMLARLAEALAAFDVHTVPRSLTITQFALGLFAEAGAIATRLDRFTPLLTDDLLTLFPATHDLAPGFDFESEDHEIGNGSPPGEPVAEP